MANIVFFDIVNNLQSLKPLTFTRPAACLRCGILTVKEKWERRLGVAASSFLTHAPLDIKYKLTATGDNLFIAGNVLPDASLAGAVATLAPGCALVDGDDTLIACRGTVEMFEARAFDTTTRYEATLSRLDAPQDIFLCNDRELRADYDLITAGRVSQPLPSHCTLIGDPDLLFIEEGAQCTCAVFNVTDGPVYIGRDAEVMEGCCLRGPVALCDHSVFKMGAKVYGATTIGPHSKVGGEIGNVVITGYSNKAHDGYLGNAVLGEWCNLGAGCVSSNLKNDYSLIKLWNYKDGRFVRTGMQFCGLIMGDHSKAGIQTMFNTATVVGVGCNIHGAGFPRTFIPSFSFGGAAGFDRIRFDKFITTARTVMGRRHIELTQADLDLLTTLYNEED